MKRLKIAGFIALMSLCSGPIYAKRSAKLAANVSTANLGCYLRVGSTAPDFTAQAVSAQAVTAFTLSQHEGYKVLVFYPADFTFVCPTEMHALNDKLEEFKKRNCTVVAISVDSVETHKKWLATPKDEAGVEGLRFALIADPSKKIAQLYGVLNDAGDVAQRAVYIIDAEGIVRALCVTDDGIGRNVDEILRLLDAIDFHAKHGQVCPANWHAGDEGMDATTEGVVHYFSAQENA
jgi:peroxiredoxin (alkyl hydroperoxide reductase subunit C)